MKKKKTVLYWKRLLQKAEVDMSNVERMVGDRKGWKQRVKGRMDHLYKWECQKEKQYE